MKAHAAESLLWQDVSVERNEEEELLQLSLQKDLLGYICTGRSGMN